MSLREDCRDTSREGPGTAAAPGLADMVDVVLDLEVPSLPAGFELPLFQALARLVPWIASAPGAGIHPIRGTRAADGSLLVARRAKLVVRLPRDKVCAASVLEGATLAVGETAPRLGRGTFRTLQPAPTLHSPCVVTGDAGEQEFHRRLAAEVEALGVRAALLCGRRTSLSRDGREHAAWSVAVHDLAPAASLALQRTGLGRMRDIGCGLLVPHKTIVTSE